jgi:hypothetical protein|nr:nickel pincer cofactor biosynthesis protein LarB [Kofleriaceae bacterium]
MTADLVADLNREQRTGVPELVYGAGKTADQIARALGELAMRGRGAIATRVDADKARDVCARVASAVYRDVASCVEVPAAAGAARPACGSIAIVCAGTSDVPVAEEVAVVAEFLGAPVVRIADVGVAGMHRLIARIEDIRACDVVVAVAGMEAALPSVLGGMVDAPMIAVPTSVGYGVSVGGLVALGALLAACAPGITIVNIDNGVGAAVAAVRIARLAALAKRAAP